MSLGQFIILVIGILSAYVAVTTIRNFHDED
jgi:hypothetical protein